MPSADRPHLGALITGDPAHAWRAGGFQVDAAGRVRLGATTLVATGDGGGHQRWSWSTGTAPGLVDGIDLLADTAQPNDTAQANDTAQPNDTAEPGDTAEPSSTAHPNRVIALDHVVVRSPDVERTQAALGELGLVCARVRTITVGDSPVEQRFFVARDTVIELVGPAPGTGDPALGDLGVAEPATIWGIACVVDDIDATAAALGDACSAPKGAVQPGRRIATLRTRDLGIGPTVAFMTPRP